MRAAPLAFALLCLLAGGALLGGCGGTDEGAETAGGPAVVASRPAPPKSGFPSAEGRTLRQVVKAADARSELIVSPLAEVFYPGPNRYPLGLYERDTRAPVSDAEVALYFAKVPPPKPEARSKSGNRGQVAKAQAQALDEPAIGPFPVAVESLATKPRFRADSTAEDPGAARVVYATTLDFPSAGEWRVAAVIERDGELTGKVLPSANVGEFKRVPRVGQRPPRIHTPTAQDVGGELSKITTREPPEAMNKVDFADAVGKEPVVLLFATPRFCQSRVCGPVVDVTTQVQDEYRDKAAFIHMEIFNDNDPGEGVRPQVRAFRLPTEPWLFTIDRSGRISGAIEGPFGLKLLRRAVDKAIAE
jgi:hypothetical protein